MPIIKLTLAATASLLLYGLYKVASRLLHPYFSSLKHLPGPDSSSFIYGNVKELRDIEKSTLFEDWTRKYGKVMKIHLLFGVRITPAMFPIDIDWSTERMHTQFGY